MRQPWACLSTKDRNLRDKNKTLSQTYIFLQEPLNSYFLCNYFELFYSHSQVNIFYLSVQIFWYVIHSVENITIDVESRHNKARRNAVWIYIKKKKALKRIVSNLQRVHSDDGTFHGSIVQHGTLQPHGATDHKISIDQPYKSSKSYHLQQHARIFIMLNKVSQSWNKNNTTWSHLYVEAKKESRLCKNRKWNCGYHSQWRGEHGKMWVKGHRVAAV